MALSLELLRSFARRTHRAVSDAFANTAPAVVAKLATNSVGSNTLALETSIEEQSEYSEYSV